MDLLDFHFQALKLKDLKRTGWIQRKVSNPETVASHLWDLSLLVLMHAKSLGYNELKCLKLAIVSDLVESITGDIATHKKFLSQKNSLKRKEFQEIKAVQKLVSKIKNLKLKKEIQLLCLDYVQKKSKEAKFVSDLDKVEVCLQALYYAKHKRTRKNLFEFFETSYSRLFTLDGFRLLEEVFAEFQKLKR
ncbi:MAG: HD domain-containing protein [Candidatus Diapherotrites archaeon]|nr:HD domain-containing protein [Candidatus Diapherotrites archaeon]